MVARLLTIGALAGLAACAPTRGEVAIINRSSETISHVDLRVASEQFSAEDVRTGDRVTFVFEPFGDSSYDVIVTLASGRRLAARLGYVTDGHPSRDEIYVFDNRLALEPGFQRTPCQNDRPSPIADMTHPEGNRCELQLTMGRVATRPILKPIATVDDK